jgi:hypothetical protein
LRRATVQAIHEYADVRVPAGGDADHSIARREAAVRHDQPTLRSISPLASHCPRASDSVR